MIQSQDQAWTSKDPSIESTARDITENEVSAYLTNFQNSNPEEVEVFVTDARGLNIAMTARTSDFLQADEDWWKSAFADGKGATYLGAVEYDDSAQTYAMDIGVPILNPETKLAIGIIRGTLDISVMVKALQNVDVGSTGNIVLMDRTGTVLYSRNKQDFMTTVPDIILELVASGQSGWRQATDMAGKPAIVAYSSLKQESGRSMGWHLLITQTEREANQGVVIGLIISTLAGLLVMVIGVYLSRFVIRHAISYPIEMLTTSAHKLSLGDITQNGNSILEQVKKRKDEIGEIKRAFDRLILYFQGAAAASTAIANKDLAVNIAANSESDTLGNAFVKMVNGLREIIRQVSESAETVSVAASQLASASGESGKATNQIATTIQQVAQGTIQQSREVANTSSSVEQMNRVIKDVAQDARKQAQAIYQAARFTTNINAAIEQMSSNAQFSAQGARQAAEFGPRGGTNR